MNHRFFWAKNRLAGIVINQDKILVDGMHHIKGKERAGETEIECIVEHIDEKDIYKKSVIMK